MEYLKKPSGILKKGDTVVFMVNGKKIIYEVYENFLFNHKMCDNHYYNDHIFIELGIDPTNFAKVHFEYYPLNSANLRNSKIHNFPESVIDDYPALTRTVKALYEEIDLRVKKGVIKYAPANYEKVEVNNNNKLNHGEIIKVTRVTPTVVRGEEIVGCRIPGQVRTATVRVGHLSYSEIIGRGY